MAARGSDRLAIAELRRYLRGRDSNDLQQRLRAGALDGGAQEVPIFPDEVRALEWMLAESTPGDLLAITALAQRPEIFALLEGRGASRIGPDRVRELVKNARRT